MEKRTHAENIFFKNVLLLSNAAWKLNYFDVTFNVHDGLNKPDEKQRTKYIHIDSDYPPSIIK